MDDEKAWRDLNAVAWAHVGAERFDVAEVAIRELIDRTDLQDPLWKVGRHEDARSAAKSAIDAAPTDERRLDLTNELAHILRLGEPLRMPANHNSMEIPDERELDEQERALVRWLLEHGTPDAAPYLAQVPLARVVSRCACGFASLNFDIGGQGWRSPGGHEESVRA